MHILIPWWREHSTQYGQTSSMDEDDLLQYLDWEKIAEEASADKRLNPLGIDLTRKAYIQEIDSRIMGAWTA